MKKKIKNNDDLRAEIKRLQLLADEQEIIIREDIADIREQLRPKNILMNAVESITGIKVSSKDFFMGGLGTGLLLLLRKTIFKTEEKAEEKTDEFPDSFFGRIRKFLSSFLNVRKHHGDESGD